MKGKSGDAFAVPEFILGDRQLHARFSLALELLARVVLAPSSTMTTASLAEAVGQSPRAIRGVLAALQQGGLLRQDGAIGEAWMCLSNPGVITLADVFRSVAAAETASARKKADAQPNEDMRASGQPGVDLLLMQATVAINQLVLQHLQAFDLGRLKAVGSSGGFQPFPLSSRPYVAEPA